MKILLGVTGSVAAKLTPVMVRELVLAGHEVQVVASEKSLYFWKETDLSPEVKIWRDKDEWVGELYEKNQEIPHIQLRNWADIILLAPLSANTLAKIANGMADNLLTSVMRAWDCTKSVVLAPAMNTLMWNHPVTNSQIRILNSWYPKFYMAEPVVKKLACNESGIGAMADISNIVKLVSTC